MGDDWYKYMGAITGALGIYVAIGLLAGGIFGHGSDGHEELAYALAIDGAEMSEPEPEEEAVPLPVLLASADASAGERVFRRCQSCHNVDPAGANGTGPALYGIMGKEIGVAAGFNYSDTLAGMGGVWDWDAMNGFLESPSGWAPGTRMAFAGLRDPEERAAVMLYLNENSAAPIAPPSEEATQ